MEIQNKLIEKFSIKLENVPNSIHEDGIREIFKKTFQTILEDVECVETGETKIFHIRLSDPIKASLAINTLNNMMIQESRIVASWIDSNDNNTMVGASIYIGNLDENINEKTLQKMLSKIGFIRHVKIFKNLSTTKNGSYAFVTFYNSEDATNAIKNFNGTVLMKNKVIVNAAYSDINLPSTTTLKHNNKLNNKKAISTIYIGNINSQFDELFLNDYFKRFGHVELVKLFKGYAFIRFADSKNANDAIKITDGSLINGIKIKTSWAYTDHSRNSTKIKDEKKSPDIIINTNANDPIKLEKKTNGHKIMTLSSSDKIFIENYPSDTVKFFPNLFDLKKIVDQYDDVSMSNFYSIKDI